MDRRHHWEDVLVGGLLGNAVALVMHRLYIDLPGISPFKYEKPNAARADEEKSLALYPV